MHKKNDYRTVEEKLHSFLYRNHKKIIIYSFVAALIIILISFLTSNKEGLKTIIIYPIALLGFILDLKIEGRVKYIRYSFSITMILLALMLFVLGFFI